MIPRVLQGRSLGLPKKRSLDNKTDRPKTLADLRYGCPRPGICVRLLLHDQPSRPTSRQGLHQCQRLELQRNMTLRPLCLILLSPQVKAPDHQRLYLQSQQSRPKVKICPRDPAVSSHRDQVFQVPMETLVVSLGMNHVTIAPSLPHRCVRQSLQPRRREWHKSRHRRTRLPCLGRALPLPTLMD